MKLKNLLSMTLVALLFSSTLTISQAKSKKDADLKLKKGLYAVFHTSVGDITVKLFPKKVPKTVENFVGLAEGTKEWVKPGTSIKTKKPLYSNTVFHRIIPNFMIQGGDPMGTGRGGPGYRFADEFHKKLRHDKPGILSMANSGPNTNGSQFFITHRATPWLDNKHAVFGEVVKGMDIVFKMGQVKRNRSDRPLTDIVLKNIEILRIK
jgi:peptidyl-prolyl cis-trans isomerase A (cyclophilin A)